MKSRTWMTLATVAVALAVFLALAPAALAQGPGSGNGPGDGTGPIVGGSFGDGNGYGPGDGSGPIVGGAFGPGSGYGVGDGSGPIVGASFGPGGQGAGGAMRGQMGGSAGSLVAVAAEQLGMTRTELVAELQAGKTIAEVAEANSVALGTIVEAFVAPREERLAALVAAGQLTQEEADARLATMRAHVTARLSQAWSPRGPGAGAGFVDADGDGVCDNAGSGRMAGRGRR